MSVNRDEAEKAFISAVLVDNLILASCQLTAPMFTKYRKVWESIEAVAKKGRVGVAELIVAGTDADLVMGLDPYTTAGWEFFHRAIFEAWAADQVNLAARRAVTLPYPESVQELDKAMTEVTMKETGSRTKKLTELLEPALTRIMQRRAAGGVIPGILFGFQAIDFATMGARPGQLIVIGARPSDGKSALMSQLARNMAKAVKVGIFTIESDEDELTDRMLSAEARVDSRLLATGKLSAADLANVKEGAMRLNDLRDNVVIHDQPGIKLNQLQSVARRMVRDGCKCLFIDYLQIINVPGNKDKREQVAEASTALKSLARELKVPVVVLAQLRRPENDRRPGLGDFQHSSQIEQDADQGWMIWHKTNSDGEVTESRIILAKVRDGMTRDIFVKFNRPVLTFYEVTND